MTAPAATPKKKPEPYTDHAEYASLRCVNLTDAGRTGGPTPTLIHSGPGRTLVLSSRAGYYTFRIRESGLEIPVTNVASATPKGVAAAGRIKRTDKEGIEQKREARLAKAEQRREAQAAKAEEIAKKKAEERAAKARERAARKQGWNEEDADE
jgi:hypothetical protein